MSLADSAARQITLVIFNDERLGLTVECQAAPNCKLFAVSKENRPRVTALLTAIAADQKRLLSNADGACGRHARSFDAHVCDAWPEQARCWRQ